MSKKCRVSERARVELFVGGEFEKLLLPPLVVILEWLFRSFGVEESEKEDKEMLTLESDALSLPLMGEIEVSGGLGSENGDMEASVATATADFWWESPVQLSAMISNFSTSYNVVNISLVLPILDSIHHVSEEEEATCASSLLLGMVVGQLVGGALGDSFLGRLGALRVVMAFQIIASIVSSLLRGPKLLFWLAVWRFLLGIGAGGVYPLAAVLSAEQGHAHAPKTEDETPQERMQQLRRVVWTFSMQGVGFLAVPLLTVPLLYLLPNNLNLVWRLVLAFGCVPGLILVGLQWKIHKERSAIQHHDSLPMEEPEEDDVEVNESGINHEAGTQSSSTNHPDVSLVPGNGNESHCKEQEAASQSSSNRRRDFSLVAGHEHHDELSTTNTVSTTSSLFGSIWNEPRLVQKLLGTAGTWFLFDVLFYGNTLFQPVVMEAAFGGGEGRDVLKKAATDSLILALIALPGYILSTLVIGKRLCYVRQTPRFVQMQGFVAMSLLYAIIGAYWSYLKRIPWLLVLLYGGTFAFANYGPNTTTFVFPSLMYSPECRSTLNGISAAAGKAGALLGATMFEPASQALGDDRVMLICAGVSVLAFCMTYFFVRLPPVHPEV